mmetsp:Transcript_12580/g.14434  ORF Transcript_12580/g.14434 Transcript_12580/m.14434 type:complete len:151 (+) Transcript_12580:32-484(+)
MTIRVSLDDLPETVSLHYGTSAYIITSAGILSPRVTNVEVIFDQVIVEPNPVDNNTNEPKQQQTIIRTRLGKSACKELKANQNLTILWPANSYVSTNGATGGKRENNEEKDTMVLSLIVDERLLTNIPPEGGGEIEIVPLSAMQHAPRTL